MGEIARARGTQSGPSRWVDVSVVAVMRRLPASGRLEDMNEVVRFLDNRVNCWSRVNLLNGDPIWISIAQSGVVVRRSRLGLAGWILYKEANAHRVTQTVQAIEKKIGTASCPQGMHSRFLRGFTSAAIASDSAASLTQLLNTICETTTTDSEAAGPARISEAGRRMSESDFELASRQGALIRDHILEHLPKIVSASGVAREGRRTFAIDIERYAEAIALAIFDVMISARVGRDRGLQIIGLMEMALRDDGRSRLPPERRILVRTMQLSPVVAEVLLSPSGGRPDILPLVLQVTRGASASETSHNLGRYSQALSDLISAFIIAACKAADIAADE